MNIKVNALELASELADLAVRTHICDNENLEQGDGEWERVYKMEDDIIVYTEQAQEIFNHCYDYYYNMLLKFKI